MKQPKILFILTVFILLSQVVGAKAATWQEMLQSNFDIVETFDDLQDWSANGLYPSGSGDSRAYDPALLPKKMDSTPSRWGYWANKYPTAIVGSISNGPFVAGEIVVNGKGAKWEYRRTHVIDGVTYVQLRDPVLGSVGKFQVGDTLIGQTSGATATITGWPKIIANHGTSTWRGNGKSLMMNLGDNDNGAGAMAGLGAQRLGMFFGDGISGKSGYKKLHLFMMVKFSPKFFGMTGSQSDVDYISVFKFLDICSGFTSINKFGSLADQASIEKTAQTTTEYGANQSIINLNGGGLSMAGRAVTVENIAVATITPDSSPVTYYGKVAKSVNMNNNDPLYTTYGNDINKVQPSVAAGEWFGLEIITDIGTPNNSDGSTELFVYDKIGVVKGHYKATGQLKLVKFDHYYNKIVLGGNRRTGTATSSTDGRYWIDDFIVDGTRIAPTYFQLLASAADTTNPTAAITAPTSGASVSGSNTVTVNAADNVAVSKVEFLVNGVVEGTSTTAPYSFAWNTTTVPNGSVTLSAKAYDVAGNVDQSGVSVSVNNLLPDTIPPTVSVLRPSAGSTPKGTVQVDVGATDNVAVTKVELYVDGVIYAIYGSAPFSMSWNTAAYANGTHILKAKAYDAKGNAGVSVDVSVSIANDTIAPTVSFTAPAASSMVGGKVAVTANATDNFGVTEVEFYLNGTLKATSTAAPYGFSLDTSALANGTYSLSAKAYDASGNVGQSQISITVFNDRQAPQVSFAAPMIDSVVRDLVEVRPDATDDVAVARVELYLNDVLFSTSVSAPYIMIWDSKADVNGSYNLLLKAYDVAGNVGQSTTLTVQVDNDAIAPVLALDPVTGKTTSSTRIISGQASDNVQVVKVTAQVGSGAPIDAVISGTTWTCTLADLVIGSNEVVITAVDGSGNHSQVFATVKRR